MEFLKVQPSGYVRLFDNYRRRLGRRGRSRFHLFRGRFSIGTEMPPDFVREVVIERTGVRFLVRNAQFGQVLYNHIALHFQFAR
jgi:hypothetical protein